MKETDFVSSFSNYGKTEPVGSFVGTSVPETDWAPDQQSPSAIPTRPPERGNGLTVPTGENFQPYDYGVTEPVPTISDLQGFMPAVGWLVCVEGADRGRDYRLHAGYNRIGRNPSNDVCISGDNTIARENQVLVAFDPDEKIFFCAPGQGINLVRLNGKALMESKQLSNGDVLTVGTTKLMFIPLCSDTFSW